VLEEAEDGNRRGVLVPVLIDAVSPPIGFRAVQASNLTGWDGNAGAPALLQLVAALGGRPKEASPSRVAPSRARRVRLWAALVLGGVVLLGAAGIGYLKTRDRRTTIGTEPSASMSAVPAGSSSPADVQAAGLASAPATASAPLGASGDWTGELVAGAYRLCNRSGASTASFTSVFTYFDGGDAGPVDQSDARVSMVVKLEGALAKYSAAGIAYRASRQDDSYSAFALSAGHSVTLLRSRGQSMKIVATWTLDGAKDGDPIRLKVEGDGPVVRLYVNDKLVDTDTETATAHGNPGVFAMSQGCFIFDEVTVQLPKL
jgi:hypothetical protein